ncbi:MAG: hypothetical protein K8V75_06980 [Methanobrevibacter woesei]|nr:hypothetical protein [Methanobrevibacter woesei]
MIKKLNPKHLERLLNNKCDVKLYQEGLSEEGEPLPAFELKNQKCRFIEKTKTVITADGKKVELVGKVILLGDISILEERNYTVKEINEKTVNVFNKLPVRLKTERKEVKKITGGDVFVDGNKYQIYLASKPRNPDGSVHHTTLELK